jgi:pimeloyl-ACP methyl ester carboxylesterase
VTAGVVVERRVVRSRRAGSSGADELGGLHGNEMPVHTEDGLLLHVEVDEVAPYASAGRSDADEQTLVFVHGYALSLVCWYFQREFFRGKHRLVFYDQRSHGRSEKSDNAHATIDQLGDDLAQVLADVVPQGPVILVGHSMGGMTIMAFAERHPDVFEQRVRGVGLVATTAGGLKTHHLVSRLIPDAVGGQLGPRLIAGLARAPRLVDTVRRRGSNIGFLVADQFAFGGEVPASFVEFVDNMLAATPFEVLAQFFPHFEALDKFAVLKAFAEIPTTILCGTKDLLTSIGHSRKMAKMLHGSTLVEVAGAGHMVILERADKVNAALDDLLAAGERRYAAARAS